MLAPFAATLVLAASAPAAAGGTPPAEAPHAHGFGMGAQTELISPNVGVAAVLATFDAGWINYEGSVGIGVFERGANAPQDTDVYGFGARVYLPVHRAARADFLVGGGVAYSLLDSAAGTSHVWAALAGAKVRIFVVPNAAVVGALGVGALFRDEGNALTLGARPLGSAGFVYYFE